MDPAGMTAEEAKRHLDAGEAVTFLGARSEDAWQKADKQIPNSIRVPAEHAKDHINEIRSDGLLVPYCTCPHEESSLRVARALADLGWSNIHPLVGGLAAWEHAGYPTEPKTTKKLTPGEVSENLWKAEGGDEARE